MKIAALRGWTQAQRNVAIIAILTALGVEAKGVAFARRRMMGETA